jgi:hypothetical protein
MALLRPREERPELRTLRRTHGVLRCPLNGHQAGACRGLCEPSPDGYGLCGRLAPHALMGRTQTAIAEHEAQKESPLRLRSGPPPRPPRALTQPEETRGGV